MYVAFAGLVSTGYTPTLRTTVDAWGDNRNYQCDAGNGKKTIESSSPSINGLY